MDRAGLLQLPVPAPGPIGSEALIDKPQAVGDPALVVLADYIATVLNHDCQAAWQALVPVEHRGVIRGPRGVEGVGRGTVVREVVFSNPVPLNPTGPNTRYVNVDNLPALYVYRDFRNGKKEQYTSDTNRRTSVIKVEWIAPITSDKVDILLRSSFHNAIAASIERAIRLQRHRAWVIPSDDVAPLALATTTTQTSPWVVEGALFNGPEGNGVIFPARPILLSTPSFPTPTYSLSPIRVSGIDHKHRPWAEAVSLTSATGPNRVNSVWRFERVTRVEFPGMPVAGAPLFIGYYVSPDQREGSLVMRHAGFSRMQVVQPGDLRPVPLSPSGEGQESPSLGAALGLEMSIHVEEDLTIDPTEHAQVWDSVTSIESRILANGGTWSVDHFTLPEPIQL